MNIKVTATRLFRFMKQRRAQQATDRGFKKMSENIVLKKLTKEQEAEAKAY